MTTRRGELSIDVSEFQLLGKAIRPLPDKWKGLADIDTRLRERYVDLIANERTREIFEIRRKVVLAIREHLQGEGFYEVEGPMLSTIQGGASARPFITHHNALDLDLYLRIALELHLKRLIVGGMERVFEIGRVFRNEGVDTSHNPEFTMLEAYQAYGDYHDMMDLTEGLIVHAAKTALDGKLEVTLDGEPLDLSPPWPRVRMTDLIQEKTGVSMSPTMPVEEARAILDGMGLAYESDWGAGRLMKTVYDEKAQHMVRGPLFCLDYPQEVSPLARAHRSEAGYVERFELIVGGHELCNAYSEQNNPVLQLEAFESEARAKAEGDPEAGDIDLDYVRALEYGMPCTGGLGIGVDRLVMLIASVDSIREVILFPTLRPEFPSTAGPAGGGGSGIPAVRAAMAAAAHGERRRRRDGPERERARDARRGRRGGTPGAPAWSAPRARCAHRDHGDRDAARIGAVPARAARRARRVPHAAVVPGERARRHRAHRPRARRAGRRGRQGQAARLAARGGTVRVRDGHPSAEGPAPGLGRVQRRHAGGLRRQPAALPRAVGSALGPAPGAHRAAVRGVGLRLQRGEPVLRARSARAGPVARRRGLDDARRPRRRRRHLHLRQPALRPLVRGGAAGAGRRRPRRIALAALPSARHPERAHRRRVGARRGPRAHLRLGHARLLRAARGQELLLLLRRSGDDRLHVHGGLCARGGRSDRSARIARPGRGRVPRDVRRTRVEPVVPRGARGRSADVRRARHAPLLPRRRSDHPVRHVHARGREDEGRSARR